MKIINVLKLTQEDRLFYWIEERYQIYLRRLRGDPMPWTDDEILQHWWFTNPYREYDKTTVWFRENIREPMRGSKFILPATVLFRWINLPSTCQLLLDQDLFSSWNTGRAVDLLQRHLNDGNKLTSGAYLITPATSNKPKVRRICEDYVGTAWEMNNEFYRALSKPGATLRQAHALLQLLPGMGGTGFVAGQVVCDLKYTDLLENAPDWDTWCCPGPGSRAGMNLLRGTVMTHKVPHFRKNVNRLRRLAETRLPDFPLFHAQDFQNCLCEYHKYELVLRGKRLRGRRYQGHGQPHPYRSPDMYSILQKVGIY